MTDKTQFEQWAQAILGDNPTWRESGPGELAWQAWQASRTAALEEAAKVCEERMTYWQRDDNRRDEDDCCAAAIRALRSVGGGKEA